MDRYALYNFAFPDAKCMQTNCFKEELVKVPASTTDKNLWLDRLFGGKKTDVRIQNVKKHATADKYPCTVLAHEDRVVWLRMENEKSMRLYVKSHSLTSDPDPIEPQDMPTK